MTHPRGNGNNSLPTDNENAAAKQMDDNKVALRQALLEKRRNLDKYQKAHWDALIASQIMHWCQSRQLSYLGVYWPIQGEPDLRPLYQELIKRKCNLALPRTIAADQALEFAPWTLGDTLVRDAMGVLSPADTTNIVTPAAILIPCVGYNTALFRLGYGGGFYDRTLAQLPPQTISIGIAYSCLLAEFDAALHDIALQQIITEKVL